MLSLKCITSTSYFETVGYHTLLISYTDFNTRRNFASSSHHIFHDDYVLFRHEKYFECLFICL
jgi:hypothetical protein